MCVLEHIVRCVKERGEGAAEPDLARIQNACDMQSASRALYEAMKRYPGHYARSELITCFRSRILEESDMDSIYDAFEDMYRRYKRSGDLLAMKIARMLGEKGCTVYKVEKM